MTEPDVSIGRLPERIAIVVEGMCMVRRLNPFGKESAIDTRGDRRNDDEQTSKDQSLAQSHFRNSRFVYDGTQSKVHDFPINLVLDLGHRVSREYA